MSKKTKTEEVEVAKAEEIAPEAVAETPVVETEKSDEVVDETTEKTDDVVETTEVAETEKAAHPDKETEEEDSKEGPDAEMKEEEKAKKSDEVIVDAITDVKNTLTSAFSDLVETVKSLQAEVEMLKSTKVDTELVRNSLDAVAKDIAAATEQVNRFGKRVDAVEADTAFRKSGDLGEIVQEQPEMVEKSLWGGRFLKTADLFK